MKHVDMKLRSLFEAGKLINAVTYGSMLYQTQLVASTVVCSSEVLALILFKLRGL